MNWRERLAIITIGSILVEHLQAEENLQAPGILPSDRLRAAIDILHQEYNPEAEAAQGGVTNG